MVRRVLRPWFAAALPEIMAGALQERKLDVPERSTKVKQQASNRAAPPEHAEMDRQEPERGLTFEVTGPRRRAA